MTNATTEPNPTQPKAIKRLGKRAVSDGDETETGFMALALELFGKVEMDGHGGIWRTLFRQNSGKAWRVLRETRATAMDRPGEIRTTRAKFAMDLWKRFK